MQSKFQLFETKNYGSFRYLHYNRAINPKIVDSLVQSIKKHGLTMPIVVSNDRFVIDGQHRLAALTRLQLPVPYIVTQKYNSEQVRETNNIQKGWKLEDYITSAASTGNVDCKALLEQIETYPDINVSVVARIFSHNHTRSKAVFVNNEYRFDMDRGTKFLDYLDKIEEVVPVKVRNKVYSSNFVDALNGIIKANDEFDIKRLAHAAQKNPIMFYGKIPDIQDSLVYVYNHGLQKGLISKPNE